MLVCVEPPFLRIQSNIKYAFTVNDVWMYLCIEWNWTTPPTLANISYPLISYSRIHWEQTFIILFSFYELFTVHTLFVPNTRCHCRCHCRIYFPSISSPKSTKKKNNNSKHGCSNFRRGYVFHITQATLTFQ